MKRNINTDLISLSLLFMYFLCFFSESFAQEIQLERIKIRNSSQGDPLQEAAFFSYDEIQEIPLYSIEEVIEYSASIDLRRRSNFGVQQDVSMRGSVFEDVSINLQGFELNDPQTGHFNLEIPLTSADLEHIEISKNAQRINYVPKKPKDEGAILKTSFGEHALREQLLSVNFAAAGSKNRFSAEHKESKGDRMDTDFEIFNFSFHSLWEEENKEIEFLFGSTKRDFGANAFYSDRFVHEEEHINQKFFSMLTSIKNDLIEFQNSAFLRRHSDKFILNRHNPSFYTNYHTTYVYGFKSKLDFYQDYFLDVELEREAIESSNLNEHYRLKKGISLGVEEKRIDRFLFTLTANLDYYEDWQYLESFHFHTGYFLLDNLRLGASYDRIYRVPTFTELYYVSPSNMGSDELEVQKSNNYELGVDFALDDVFLVSANGFIRNQFDTIDWVREDTADPWQADNVGDLDAYGFECFTKINFPWPYLKSCSLDYAYLDLRNDNPFNFSKYVFDYNEHKLVGMVGFDIAECSLNLICNYSSPIEREEYLIFDMKMQRKFSDFIVSFEATNIFDQAFKELQDIEGAGRWIRASASVSF